MTIRQKLHLLQKLSGLTQEDLADKLDVTFAAFNRWINGKAQPRPQALARIDALYRRYSGEGSIPADALVAKKLIIHAKRAKHPQPLKDILAHPDLRDQFLLALTYHSNRIEGNTLTKDETATILFDNAALPHKSLTEQLEAKNHQTALEYLFSYCLQRKALNEALILKLHTTLMSGVRSDAGYYRNHAVRILGAHVPTANFLKIPMLMKELIRSLQRPVRDGIAHMAAIHARFEQIHPFSDGNGRVGRLLMHAMAFRSKLPPPVIRQEQRRLYMRYLEKAQLENDQSLLEDFLCDAFLEGYAILERR